MAHACGLRCFARGASRRRYPGDVLIPGFFADIHEQEPEIAERAPVASQDRQVEASQGLLKARSRGGALHVRGIAPGTAKRRDARLLNHPAEFHRRWRNWGLRRQWWRRWWQGQSGSLPVDVPCGFTPDLGRLGPAGGSGFGSAGPLLCHDVQQAKLADQFLHGPIGLRRIGQASRREPSGRFPNSRGTAFGPPGLLQGRGRPRRSGRCFIGKHRPQYPPESAQVRTPRALRLESADRYPQHRSRGSKLNGAAAHGTVGVACLMEFAESLGDVVGVAQGDGQRKRPALQPLGQGLAPARPLFGLRLHDKPKLIPTG